MIIYWVSIMVFSWVILTHLFSFKNKTYLNHKKHMCYLCNNYGLMLRATKDLNKRPKDPKERGRSEEKTGENEGGVSASFYVCTCMHWIVL